MKSRKIMAEVEQKQNVARGGAGQHGSQNAVLQASGLTKIFKDFWGRPKAKAVQNLDMSVPPGCVFGLLGPNGSGKSTVVKMVLGLLYPTRGNLRVMDGSPRDVQAKRRIGYLPEESYLYRYLTAYETLDFFGALFGLTADERRRRSDELLEMVGLTASRTRLVGEFSKGMARRIGLAQALINDPDLIILDEPTSGLDPIGCREVKDIIRHLASRGKTILLSSHLLADVEDVCDQIMILYGGQTRARGGLQEVLQVQEKTQLTMPYLEPAALENVINAIRRHLNEHDEVSVEHPTRNLEDFFLEVVRQAREASVETAGVQTGGRIAEYLQQGAVTEEEERKARVLESLARPDEGSEEKEPSGQEETVEAGTEAGGKRGGEASERLHQVMQGTAEKGGPAAEYEQEGAGTESGPAEEKSDDERRRASERLKGLLSEDEEKRQDDNK